MMLFMVPKECDFSLRCFAKLDVWLLFLNAFSCSLNRGAKRLPVCPIYATRGRLVVVLIQNQIEIL